MKRITLMLCSILLIVLFCIACCSCKKETQEEGTVRSTVMLYGLYQYKVAYFEQLEMSKSEATVTKIKKTSENMYRVNGKMVMTDIYGREWYNNYYVDVECVEKYCTVGTFKYENSWKEVK